MTTESIIDSFTLFTSSTDKVNNSASFTSISISSLGNINDELTKLKTKIMKQELIQPYLIGGKYNTTTSNKYDSSSYSASTSKYSTTKYSTTNPSTNNYDSSFYSKNSTSKNSKNSTNLTNTYNNSISNTSDNNHSSTNNFLSVNDSDMASIHLTTKNDMSFSLSLSESSDSDTSETTPHKTNKLPTNH